MDLAKNDASFIMYLCYRRELSSRQVHLLVKQQYLRLNFEQVWAEPTLGQIDSFPINFGSGPRLKLGSGLDYTKFFGPKPGPKIEKYFGPCLDRGIG